MIRKPVLALGLFMLGGGLLGVTAAPAHGAPDSVSTFYVERGSQVPLTVYQNQVGVLIPGGLRGTQLQSLASQFGLQPLYSSKGGIYTWELPQGVDRDSILDLARRIEKEARLVVRAAGIVVSRPARFAPMLVTKEFVVHFHPWIPRSTIDSLNAAQGVEIVLERPNRPNRFLLRALPETDSDGLALGNIYAAPRFAQLAHANFVHGIAAAHTPTDEYFGDQWHHENPGSGGLLADADIDTPKAWDLTKGSSTVVIAVIDGGFDPDHPDLKGSLWENPDETGSGGGGGSDDFPGDLHGWDFYDCLYESDCPWPDCGQLDFCKPPFWEMYHGTAVAGLAAAPMDNDCDATSCEGVVGVCPECKIMAIARTYDSERLAQCFDYAVDNGADVINCSWFLTDDLDENLRRAINEAACAPPDYDGPRCKTPSGFGIPIFFATGNEERDGCGTSSTDIIQEDAVIAVGGTTAMDTRAPVTTFGNCMDIMAPTHGGVQHIATVDHRESAGYNTAEAVQVAPCPTDDYLTDTNYTKCFRGTSASAPMAAGIAGLLLSVNSSLTREQIQRVLQDTADRIESNVAAYDKDTGFSTPTSLADGRGYGRVNAYEAVRLAAPAPGGRAGVDIMLRDNTLDWGNTEQPSNTLFADDADTPDVDRGFIGHWSSQDVKIVAEPCPGTAPPFDEIKDGDIAADGDNCVYIRVRNRGFVEAASGDRDGDGTNDKATVKAYWAQIGTAVPNLPSDFWSGFSTNTFTQDDWHFIGKDEIEGVPYSGSTAAREARVSDAEDQAQIAMITFKGPELDPTVRNHYCLLAMVDSPDDHIAAYQRFRDTGSNDPEDFDPDLLTPSDNNVSHRNYELFDTSDETAFSSTFYARNTGKQAIETTIDVKHPPGWRVELDGPGLRKSFPLKPGAARPMTLKVHVPRKGIDGEVTVIQRRAGSKDQKTKRAEVLGGLTLFFAGRGSK